MAWVGPCGHVCTVGGEVDLSWSSCSSGGEGGSVFEGYLNAIVPCSNPAPTRPTAKSVISKVGCHLEGCSTVGWPLRGAKVHKIYF